MDFSSTSGCDEPHANVVTATEAAIFQPLGHRILRGRSGRSFTLTVYGLIGCPAPLAALYFLVRRDPESGPHIVAMGRCVSDIASLNLAEIRRIGAHLGATEVHLLALGDIVDDIGAPSVDAA